MAAHTIAELWLTAAGHSLWEHLSGEPMPWRRVVWDKTVLADPRAEALLIGLLLVVPEETRRGAAGLRDWHFRDERAAAVWRGEKQPAYEAYALDEFGLTQSALVDEQMRLHWNGEATPLHDAGPEEVAAALASRIMQLYEARWHIQQASALLAGQLLGRGGVQL